MRGLTSLLVLTALLARAAEPPAGAPVAAPAPPAPAGSAPSARLLPPLSDAQGDGKLDFDLAEAVDEAKAQLAKGDVAGASHKLITLLSSNDRFTHAQRTGLAELAAPVLHEAGKAQAAHGHWPEAAQAFDAAWTARGRRADPEYSAALVEWAKQRRAASPREALWLARRARLADPTSATAVDLDTEWSTNSLRWPGWLAIGLGAAGFVTSFTTWQVGDAARKKIVESLTVQPRATLDGYLSTMHGMGIAAMVSLVAGIALWAAGFTLIYVGQPIGPPVSPDTLPSLEGR